MSLFNCAIHNSHYYALIAFLGISSHSFAATQPLQAQKGVALDSEGKQLPLPDKQEPGVALDSEGNPLPIPAMQHSALEFHTNPTPSSKPSKPSHTRSSKRSQKLTSEKVHVANDPSCRWLNSRIKLLKQSISYSGNKVQRSYHRKELRIRQTEWRCMKCSTEGPKHGDYDRCQYRR